MLPDFAAQEVIHKQICFQEPSISRITTMAWDLGGLGGWDSGPWSWAFGTWKLGPGTWDFGSWNLDPGTLDLGLGTWDLGFVWDLGFGTWDSRPVMCPPKLRKSDVCVLSESLSLPLPECSQMASRFSPELLCDTSYSSKKLLCTMHLHTHVLLLVCCNASG